MEIRIFFREQIYLIKVNENDTVEDLGKKCFQNILKKLPHEKHDFSLIYNNRIMGIMKSKLKFYNIKQNDVIIMYFHLEGGGCIDNLKEEAKTPIAKKIGFDMNLIKRDELHINLIHFD